MSRLPPAELRPLTSRALRERLGAPELERLLAQRDVDLVALDQVDALKVRVRKGLSVAAEQARAAERTARTMQISWLAVLLAGAVGFAVSISALGGDRVTLAGLSAAASLLVAGFSAVRVALLARDLGTLRRLRGRYDEAVDSCRSVEELLELSREIFRELEGVSCPARRPRRC